MNPVLLMMVFIKTFALYCIFPIMTRSKPMQTMGKQFHTERTQITPLGDSSQDLATVLRYATMPLQSSTKRSKVPTPVMHKQTNVLTSSLEIHPVPNLTKHSSRSVRLVNLPDQQIHSLNVPEHPEHLTRCPVRSVLPVLFFTSLAQLIYILH